MSSRFQVSSFRIHPSINFTCTPRRLHPGQVCTQVQMLRCSGQRLVSEEFLYGADVPSATLRVNSAVLEEVIKVRHQAGI